MILVISLTLARFLFGDNLFNIGAYLFILFAGFLDLCGVSFARIELFYFCLVVGIPFGFISFELSKRFIGAASFAAFVVDIVFSIICLLVHLY